MKGKILLLTGWMLWCVCNAGAVEKENIQLDNLVKIFEQNPANPQATLHLLEELNRRGQSGTDVLNRYFKTQKETDYLKDYNWTIVRDYVNDIDAPQIKYIFEHQDKFIRHFSKDDVFQKLDNILVNHLENFYWKDKAGYDLRLNRMKELRYEHYDVVFDYFSIRELRASRNADGYFYKARKLFRYFPENLKMIKEITAGAIEIMTDVSRLKVIQLWAGKTVESGSDFDAIYNYVLISSKCGYLDVARKYADVANRLAVQANNPLMKQRAGKLLKMVH